jgi:type IV secretory pathway TrbL component
VEDLGVLQRILNDIATTYAQGGIPLQSALLVFVGIFTTFALVYLAYGIFLNGSAVPGAVTLLAKLAFVVWGLEHLPSFFGGVRDLAIWLGLLTTNGGITVAEFLDPGAAVKLGLKSGKILWDAFVNNRGLTSFVNALAYLLAWVGYVSAFFLIAFRLFWWQVELLIASLAGLCLLPTLCFRAVSFVGQGILSYAANMFCRFLIGAILAGALWRHLDTLTGLPSEPGLPTLRGLDLSIQAAFVAVGGAWALALCFLSVNRLAGMLASGVPALTGAGTVGTMVRTLVGAGAAAGAVGAVGTGVVLGAGRGVAGTVQGLIGAGQATQGVGGMLASGGGERGVFGEAARQIYGGAVAGASGGVQARLGAAMGTVADVATNSRQQALRQFMGVTSRDDFHRGTHR